MSKLDFSFTDAAACAVRVVLVAAQTNTTITNKINAGKLLERTSGMATVDLRVRVGIRIVRQHSFLLLL